MFDTIILLTGEVEQPVLASVLMGYNPLLTILPVGTADDLAMLDASVLQRARLIAFATPVIVLAGILEQLGYGAYNFHPGPPLYPGWAPANFALYRQAKQFGATVHVMHKRVDSGPIVAVDLFPVPEDATVEGLEQLAYTSLGRMFWDLALPLATQAKALPELPVEWGETRYTRRDYVALCAISPDISKEELHRRLKAFGGDLYGVSLTITLHGMQYRLVPSG